MPAKIDLVGHKYHRLKVLSENGKDNHNKIMYSCLCDCGNTLIVLGASLRSGNTKSCGCLQVLSATKHGKYGSLVYKRWRGMLTRCLNEKHDSYGTYCDLEISQDFIEDFSKFYDEIGDPPDDNEVWTVDRIDPKIGYVKGNLRWATVPQQARNRKKGSRNKSGHTGVCKVTYPSGNHIWVVTWYTLDGEHKCKYFSVKKLGDSVALEMAISFRKNKIAELNGVGAGYSEHHGK